MWKFDFFSGGDGEFLLVFTAENQKDRFSLPLKLPLFIESDDNYVSIHHLLHGKPAKTLFRKSMKSIREEIHHPSLVQCHRSYQWGINYFGFQLHGAGITPDFVFLVLQLALFAGLFIATYRVRNRVVYYGLLAVWFIHTFGNLLADIAVNGDTIFEGDTLGVKVSLTWIIVPLSVLALVLILLEIRADRRAAPQQIPWTVKNKNLLWLILLGPLPVQAVLLATGKPHGLTDQIGVLMTILQSFLIPLILRPKP